jgi:hypothetical protein
MLLHFNGPHRQPWRTVLVYVSQFCDKDTWSHFCTYFWCIQRLHFSLSQLLHPRKHHPEVSCRFDSSARLHVSPSRGRHADFQATLRKKTKCSCCHIRLPPSDVLLCPPVADHLQLAQLTKVEQHGPPDVFPPHTSLPGGLFCLQATRGVQGGQGRVRAQGSGLECKYHWHSCQPWAGLWQAWHAYLCLSSREACCLVKVARV